MVRNTLAIADEASADIIPIVRTDEVRPTTGLAAGKPPRRRVRVLMTLSIGGIVGALAAGAAFRLQDRPVESGPQTATATGSATGQTKKYVRRVNVTSPVPAKPETVVLPASVLPYAVTEVYARINGYVKSWNRDIGTRVEAGDILAEIDAPELDRELTQQKALLAQSEAERDEAGAMLEEARTDILAAEANVTKARAFLEFAGGQLARNQQAVARSAVSPQELADSRRDRDARQAEVDAAIAERQRKIATVNTRKAAVATKAASIQSHRASVERLQEMVGFKTIRAPYAGAVSRRTIETGMMVTGAGPNNPSLYRISVPEKLRIQVGVPQTYIAGARAGDSVELLFPENPGVAIPATITRASRALETSSRTLTVEIELDNPNSEDGRTRRYTPNSFAEVRLAAKKATGVLELPANTLLVRPTGAFVASVVDSEIRLIPVKIVRDHGNRVEVASPLKGDERLVTNPPDTFRDGDAVEVVPSETPEAK